MAPFSIRSSVERRRSAQVALVLGVGACLWLVGLGSAGCGERTPEELFAEAEAAAADSSSQDQAVADFEEFLSRFPEHERCHEALRKLAMIAQQQGKMDRAITRYERLLTEYPGSRFAAEAQFMIAFICEEHLVDEERARQAYQRVIDRYPESELADSARRLLPNVGRKPEEWVKFQDADPGP